jgi:P22 coat protein - gene protein 5
MANISVADVDDSIPTLVAAEALGALYANVVIANVVNRDFENEIAEVGQSIKVPFLGSLTANDKAADTAITLNAPTDTAITLTLNKHKEVSFIIEDTARIFARPDLLAGYAREAAQTLATKVETDLSALYSGFSQTINAASGLTEAHFREARRLLNAAKVSQANRWAILHEDAEAEALQIEKLINRDYASSDVVPSGSLGTAFGFNIAMSQNITVATTCKNLFLQRDAIIMAVRPLPTDGNGMGVKQTTMNENNLSMRVTMSYNPDYLGIQFTLDMLYGVAELRDAAGVVVSTTEA